jgi:uncharacterized protein (DUF433 family)
MPATVDIGTLIPKDPEIHGGKPCIAGTGTTVLTIVDLYEQGYTPAQIHDEHFPHLPLEGIFAALAYWTANREEIEEWFRLDREAHDELMQYEARRRA